MAKPRESVKAELHCHLEGILDPAMACDIRRDDPAFPIDPGELERAYPVSDFESFFVWWRSIDPIKSELTRFYPIVARHIERLKAQHVLYAELMVGYYGIPRDKVEAIERVEALRQWVTQQEGGEIQVEFLVTIGRGRSPEDVEGLEECILALHREGLIVGVALAGPEQGNPVKLFRKTFRRFHDAGMGIEIHAGEWCGPESVWDALENGYPDRIGHGVSVFQAPELVEAIQERGIHLELCPTSNLKTGSVSRIEDHPVGRAKELGLRFSINTDDPGVFECSMESEYELLSDVFGFDEEDFRTIYANTLEARFQPILRMPDI